LLADLVDLVDLVDKDKALDLASGVSSAVTMNGDPWRAPDTF
jgi:hypothetical protein